MSKKIFSLAAFVFFPLFSMEQYRKQLEKGQGEFTTQFRAVDQFKILASELSAAQSAAVKFYVKIPKRSMVAHFWEEAVNDLRLITKNIQNYDTSSPTGPIRQALASDIYTVNKLIKKIDEAEAQQQGVSDLSLLRNWAEALLAFLNYVKSNRWLGIV